MILAALAVAAAVSSGPNFITWTVKESAQIGVSMGSGAEVHLILLVPETGCHDGMRVFSGRYGDFDKSLALLKKSRICDAVDQRATQFKLVKEAAKAKAKEEAR